MTKASPLQSGLLHQRDVGAHATAHSEVADHQNWHTHARYEGRQTCTRSTHLGRTQIAIDEDPIQKDVQCVADDHDDHCGSGVAHAFEKLLEGSVQHYGDHSPRHIAVVGQCHIDHLDGLPEVIHQRFECQLQCGDNHAHKRIEHYGIAQVGCHFAAFATGVERTDDGGQSERNADTENEQNEGNTTSESGRSEWQRAEASDHCVVGKLHHHLTQLREHHGGSQAEQRAIVRSIYREFMYHRFLSFFLGCKGTKRMLLDKDMTKQNARPRLRGRALSVCWIVMRQIRATLQAPA